MKKTLRFIGLFIGLGVVFNSVAQTPDYNVWPSGIVFTDLNDNTYDIDAILDSGKPVFIDAFATWCGPCWSYTQAGHLENLNVQYGPAGSDEVVVLAVESDPSTPVAQIYDSQLGDWTAGITYPVINDDDIASVINQAYYPTIIMICPDRTVTEVGQKSASQLFNYTTGCEGKASLENDPRLIVNTSANTFCPGAELQTSVVLQNYGTEPLTSATIEVFDANNELLLTKEWTGNLETYEYENVVLGTLTPEASVSLTAKITSENDDTTNDALAINIEQAPVIAVGEDSKAVTFEMNVDNYTSEIGIVFDEGSLSNPSWGDVVTLHNNSANGSNTPLGFVQIGSYPDGASPITKTWTVNNEGCHYALFIDYYGDGYTYNKPNATIKIKGNGGSSVSVNPDFEDFTVKLFEVQFEEELSINKELLKGSFNIYPNPATNQANVTFELQAEEEVTISVINTVGQVVSTTSLGKVNGSQATQLDVSNLEAGMYLVKLTTKNGETTKRLSVQ